MANGQRTLSDLDVSAIAAAVQRSSGWDPYRVALQYVAGALVFTLGLIAAIAGALPKSVASGETPYKAVVQMLGGALAWSSLAAATQIIAALAIQLMRRKYQRARATGGTAIERPNWAVWWMVFGSAPGLGALYYALTGGAALASGNDGLVPLLHLPCRLIGRFC
jgi:hypothetical protein